MSRCNTPRQRGKFDALARCGQDQAFSNQIVADPAHLPSMRQPILQALHHPERSPALAQ